MRDILVILFGCGLYFGGLYVGHNTRLVTIKTTIPLKPTSIEIVVDSLGHSDTTFIYKLK